MSRYKKVIDTFDVCLGAAIRGRRSSLKISQEEAAELLGMPARTYQRREDGSSPVMVAELERLAVILNWPAHRFVENALHDLGGIDVLMANVGGSHEDDFEVGEAPKKKDLALAANKGRKKADVPHAE